MQVRMWAAGKNIKNREKISNAARPEHNMSITLSVSSVTRAGDMEVRVTFKSQSECFLQNESSSLG